MKRLVLDAGAVAAWFVGGHGGLRTEYEAGSLSVIGPRQLPRDLLGELAQRTGADADTLAAMGVEIERLGFELRDPPTQELARWLADGLDAGRAAYAALATTLDVTLVTDDEALRSHLGPRARASSDA